MTLYYWWRSNRAGHVFERGQPVPNPDRWTAEQTARVAEQIKNMLYEVVEIPADPDIFPE